MRRRFAQVLTLATILALALAMAGAGTAYAAGAPVIVSITPADGETGVSVNTTVVITFDQVMSTTGGYSLSFVGPSFAFGPSSWSGDGKTVTLTPTSRLPYSTAYKMTIGYFFDASGQAYSNLCTINFTTEADTYPPSVTGTAPASGATSATVAGPLSVTFSEAMNPSAGTLTVAETDTPTNTVAGSTAWSNGNTTVTFTHPTAFAPGKGYTATLTGYEDAPGNVMPQYAFSFTTYTESTPPQLSSHTPVADSTDVARTTAVTLNFNEKMNTLAGDVTIADASANPVAVGAVAWSNGSMTATVASTASLAYGTTYTVTLSGFKDESNNDLGEVSFAFTTEEQEITPAPSFVTTTYAFQLATDRSACFTLNPHIPSTTTLKLYDSSVAATPIDTGVLNAYGLKDETATQFTDVELYYSDIANRPDSSTDYYISATEPGKAESSRVKLTIVIPTPIAATSPADGATDVATDAAIVLDFGKQMQQFGSITVKDTATAASVSGTATWSTDLQKLTFQPAAELAPATQYTVTYPTFWDVHGLPVMGGSFSFTTAVAKVNLTAGDLAFDLSPSTYSGSAQPVTVTGTDVGAITVKYDGNTTAPAGAGTYAVTVDVAASAKFNAITGLSLGSYTIDRKDVTITGVTAVSRAYAAGDTSVTLDLSGAAVSGRVGSDDVAPAGGAGAIADDAIGTGKSVTVSGVTLAGADAGNYILVAQPTGVTVDILPVAPTITTATLPDGTVGTACSRTLTATGTEPITWSVVSGSLPTGLTLTGSAISGTPTTSGAFSFTVRATNAAGSQDKALSLSIAAATSGGDGGLPAGDSGSADTAYSATVTGAGASDTVRVIVDASADRASVDLDAQQAAAFSDGASVKINVPETLNVSSYSVQLPAGDLASQHGGGALTLATGTGSVTLPSNMLSNVAGTDGKDAEITIGAGDKSALSQDARDAIGDRPLIQLTLSLGGAQTSWSNPSAAVTVSIPYTPTAAELSNPESIIVWYIDGSGNAVSVPNGHYDPATGTVTFSTTHFSDYAVVYSRVSFSDVAATAWYSKAVNFIAARGITGGTGNGNYSPDATLKRGDLLVMLMKALGLAPDASPANNFSDAGNTYYTGYLAAAKRLGIAGGMGDNMYEPDEEITRQDMFTLLYNALKVAGRLPQGNSGKTLADFSDAGQIGFWAKGAISLLVETGSVGGSAGKLSPTSTTTRAEMAQTLYNLLAK